MSEYGKVWSGATNKSKPTEDWHWRILDSNYLREYEVLRFIWMKKWLPGYTFSERVYNQKATGNWWRNGSVCRIDDMSMSFDKAHSIIVEDSEMILQALEKKYEKHNHPLPEVPTLNYRM